MIYGNNGFDYPMPFSYKIIPLVYDEALSYWQQLCYFKKTVDSIVDYLQGFGDSWKQGDAETLAAAKAYADSITATFRTEFDRYTAQIDAALRDMETQQNIWYNELKNDISDSTEELRQQFLQEISGMEKELSLLWLAMNYLYYQQDEKFTKLYAALKQYIDNSIAYTTGARVTVKNPVTGSITTLNAALSDLMNYMETIGSITMRQYDSLKLTMAQYEGYRITKREYRLRAYFIFFKLLQFGDFIGYVDQTFAELKDADAKTNERFLLYNPYAATVQDLKEYIKGNMAYSHGSPQKIEYENFTRNFSQFSYYNKLNISKADYRNMAVALYLIENIKKSSKVFRMRITGSVVKDNVILSGHIQLQEKPAAGVTVNLFDIMGYYEDFTPGILNLTPNLPFTTIPYYLAVVESGKQTGTRYAFKVPDPIIGTSVESYLFTLILNLDNRTHQYYAY